MTTMISETLITDKAIFNVTYDNDQYLPTIKKYSLAAKTLPQLETWMRKTGNKLEIGEEWVCSLRYYYLTKFRNNIQILVL